MQIYEIKPRGFGCNSYIVTADGKNAVVIDCAEQSVYDECLKRNLTPVAVLLTHGHFDHVGGCGKFFAQGVPLYCGEAEKPLIHSGENRSIFGGVYIPEFQIAKTFKDGESITFCGITFKVLATAGHTAGSVCYIAENSIFSGDTLFCGSVGRTDLPTGNASALLKSVKKLLALEGDYTVYCGHEQNTTLARERLYNPYKQ